ncbi:hypothetical protein ACFLYR_08335 [Chloroflexota bacterium]
MMVEAMVALGQDPLTSPYLEKIRDVVDFTFTHEGYRSDGGIYYTGTYSNGTVSITDSTLEWWPQAEGLGTACLMSMLFPDDPFYSDTINLTWSFIESQIIDHTYNGWVTEAGRMDMDKADKWHANYHNGRALMNGLVWLSDELWESYSARWFQEDSFSGSTNRVYMRGVGFDTTGTYKIAYYDGGSNHDGADGDKIQVDVYTDDADGILDESACLLTSHGSSSYGTWHAVVYKTTGNIPNSYDLVSDSDPDYIVEDSFYVHQSAIPEFPTYISAIIAVGLCFGIYYWMRRRRLAYVKA